MYTLSTLDRLEVLEFAITKWKDTPAMELPHSRVAIPTLRSLRVKARGKPAEGIPSSDGDHFFALFDALTGLYPGVEDFVSSETFYFAGAYL